MSNRSTVDLENIDLFVSSHDTLEVQVKEIFSGNADNGDYVSEASPPAAKVSKLGSSVAAIVFNEVSYGRVIIKEAGELSGLLKPGAGLLLEEYTQEANVIVVYGGKICIFYGDIKEPTIAKKPDFEFATQLAQTGAEPGYATLGEISQYRDGKHDKVLLVRLQSVGDVQNINVKQKDGNAELTDRRNYKVTDGIKTMIYSTWRNFAVDAFGSVGDYVKIDHAYAVTGSDGNLYLKTRDCDIPKASIPADEFTGDKIDLPNDLVVDKPAAKGLKLRGLKPLLAHFFSSCPQEGCFFAALVVTDSVTGALKCKKCSAVYNSKKDGAQGARVTIMYLAVEEGKTLSGKVFRGGLEKLGFVFPGNFSQDFRLPALVAQFNKDTFPRDRIHHYALGGTPVDPIINIQ